MSLQVRISLYLFAFVSIIICILWLLQSVFLEDIYMNLKIKELYENTELITDNAESEEFSAKTDSIAKENKICIFVYNNTQKRSTYTCEALEGKCDLHKIVYRREIMGFETNTENIKRITEHVTQNGGASLLSVSSGKIHGIELQQGINIGEDNTEKSVILAKTVKLQNGDELLFLFNCVISPLATTVNTLNTLLIYVSVILVFLAILFSVIIAYVISKPISDINSSAKKLAGGDYNTKFVGKGYSEVAELGETLTIAAEELSKVDRLKTELISNISHDLRTPLTLISGYAEMMKDIPDEMTEENLQIIIDESSRMKNLVNDVLDISKLQSGNAVYKMENIVISDIVETEIARYHKLRAAEGYTITFEYNAKVTVFADTTRLIQVLYNLLNNAVVHSGNDKTIRVRQTIKENRVRISIEDSGEGIAPENLPLIWDRYYKVDKSRKRASKGSGLGLSIVKTIIEAHKGRCGVESALGVGSTFWFELDII